MPEARAFHKVGINAGRWQNIDHLYAESDVLPDTTTLGLSFLPALARGTSFKGLFHGISWRRAVFDERRPTSTFKNTFQQVTFLRRITPSLFLCFYSKPREKSLAGQYNEDFFTIHRWSIVSESTFQLCSPAMRNRGPLAGLGMIMKYLPLAIFHRLAMVLSVPGGRLPP